VRDLERFLRAFGEKRLDGVEERFLRGLGLEEVGKRLDGGEGRETRGEGRGS
jgi:hypothetical protein